MSQPIRVNLGKILSGKIMWEILEGKPTNQDTARENLVGKSCGKFLQEILVGQGGGKKAI